MIVAVLWLLFAALCFSFVVGKQRVLQLGLLVLLIYCLHVAGYDLGGGWRP